MYIIQDGTAAPFLRATRAEAFEAARKALTASMRPGRARDEALAALEDAEAAPAGGGARVAASVGTAGGGRLRIWRGGLPGDPATAVAEDGRGGWLADANPDVVLHGGGEGGPCAVLHADGMGAPAEASEVRLEVEWDPSDGPGQACWWLTAAVRGVRGASHREGRTVLASGGGMPELEALAGATCRAGLGAGGPDAPGAEGVAAEVWAPAGTSWEPGRVTASRGPGGRVEIRASGRWTAWRLEVPADRRTLEEAGRACRRMAEARGRLAGAASGPVDGRG